MREETSLTTSVSNLDTIMMQRNIRMNNYGVQFSSGIAVSLDELIHHWRIYDKTNLIVGRENSNKALSILGRNFM